MKALLVLVLGLFLFATPAQAEITISQVDFGGMITDYLKFWQNVSRSTEKVVIDAPCISACTFFLGLIPENRVCITPRASLGMHQINDGTTPDPQFSAAFFRWLYPEWVQQWLKDHGGLQEEVMYMYPEDMKGHIRLCYGEYGTVSPDDLIHHSPTGK